MADDFFGVIKDTVSDKARELADKDFGSVIDDIKAKAENLLKLSSPYITRETSVYDSSLNKIIVAGFPLDGVVSSNVSADTLTKQETGIDYYYTTYYQSLEQRTLTVQILPTANCLPIMRLLALQQQETKGWFNLSVHENGKIENVYRAWIINLPEIANSKEPEDKTIVFGIKPMFVGVSIIDQPTAAEEQTYTRYGGNDSGVYDDTMIVNENTGQTESLEDFDVSGGLPMDDDLTNTFPQDDGT